MTVQDVDDYIRKKLEENSEYIKYSFYELRIEQNMSQEECNRFLELNEVYFKNKNYKVYFTGDKYCYNGIQKTVETNELMIIIKEKGE